MFCPNCGKEVNGEAEVCPECGFQLKAPKKSLNLKENINKLEPISIVGLVFAILAAIFGFILITCIFTVWNGMPTVEFYVMIPAFIGLGIGVYKFFDKKDSRHTRIASAITVILSLFTVLYAFVGYMVTLFP